jgi:hypothetical protein
MMWIDTGVTTLYKPSLPLLEPGYEAALAVRGNEEDVVRQREVDDFVPFAKVPPPPKPKRLQLHIYVMRSSERPR